VLRDHILAFDDYLQPPVSGQAVQLRSSDALADRLAKHDAFALHVIASDGSGAPGNLTVYVEHSGDGQHWAEKQPSAKINSQALTANATTTFVAYDAGFSGTLNFARIVVSADGVKADHVRVKIYVSLRDVDNDNVRAPASTVETTDWS
jgi:hypothetical protein